jgi:hypothetical protein
MLKKIRAWWFRQWHNGVSPHEHVWEKYNPESQPNHYWCTYTEVIRENPRVAQRCPSTAGVEEVDWRVN